MKQYIKLKFDSFNSNLELDKDKTIIVVENYLVYLIITFCQIIYKLIFADWLLTKKIIQYNTCQLTLESKFRQKFVILLIDSIDHNISSLYKIYNYIL